MTYQARVVAHAEINHLIQRRAQVRVRAELGPISGQGDVMSGVATRTALKMCVPKYSKKKCSKSHARRRQRIR